MTLAAAPDQWALIAVETRQRRARQYSHLSACDVHHALLPGCLPAWLAGCLPICVGLCQGPGHHAEAQWQRLLCHHHGFTLSQRPHHYLDRCGWRILSRPTQGDAVRLAGLAAYMPPEDDDAPPHWSANLCKPIIVLPQCHVSASRAAKARIFTSHGDQLCPSAVLPSVAACRACCCCWPRHQVPEAVCLPSLTYHEAWELSYFGANVLHPRTTLPAMKYSIPISIRNFFNLPAPGRHTPSCRQTAQQARQLPNCIYCSMAAQGLECAVCVVICWCCVHAMPFTLPAAP